MYSFKCPLKRKEDLKSVIGLFTIRNQEKKRKFELKASKRKNIIKITI